MPLSGLPLIPSRTWATRGTGAADGDVLRITDFGGPMGFLVCWSASLSRWVALQSIDLASVLALANGVAQTAEQVLPGQILVPAGLLMAFRKLRWFIGLAKSGGTDAMTNLKQKVGTAGTTADTLVSVGLATAMGTTNRSIGFNYDYQITSSTVLTRIGGYATGSWTGGASSAVATGAVTVSDMSSNALYLSNTVTMGGTTDTPQVAGQVLELIP